MSKRVELYRRLREKGMTYDEIGEIFGVTKQAVHDSLTKNRDGFHKSAVQKVKYIGLRNWMFENRVKISELSKRCGVGSIHKSLTGDTEPRKSTIDALLKITGMTYEECFKEDET